jgi:hypothetical protein
LERTAAVADGRDWLHEADYLLDARRGTGLRFTLPAGAVLVGVDLDGARAAPSRSTPGKVWLPLAEGAGPHRVRLRWKYAPGEEDFARPRGDDPQLEAGGKNGEPLRLWSVDVPEGYHLRPADGGSLVPASSALVEATRADAWLRQSKLLAERSPRAAEGPEDEALTRAQREFYTHVRHAEALLKLHPGDAAEKGPSGQGVGEWLKQLRQENRHLAKVLGYERLRGRAERAAEAEPREAAAGPHEHAVTWAAGAPPRFVLEARAAEVRREIWAGTVLFVLGLLAVGLLARYPGVVAAGRRLGPEWLALFGVAAWWVLGLPLYVLPVMAGVGVLARLWLVARWLEGLRARPRPATGSSGS